MSKKNHSKIVPFANPGETILARFKNAMKEDNTTNKIIEFLHVESETVLSFSMTEERETMQKYAKEYAEFYCYFMCTYYDEFVEQIIYTKWGDLPPVLDFGSVCGGYLDEMKLQAYYDRLSEEEKREAASLCERIFAMRTYRKVKVIHEENGDFFDTDLPKTIQKNESLSYKKLLKLFSAVVINGGVMIVRTYSQKPTSFFWLDPHEISAIATDDSGKWLSIPEKVFLDSHIPGTDGEILPGGDIVYTKITREI